MNINPTVLIVDDEQNTREGLKSYLEIHDYEVDTACDGYAAIDIIKMDYPDIVLTDVQMPGMDGLQLLEQIKKLSPETIVIVFTAYGTVENAVKAIQSGAFHYLSKPINTDELLEILKKAVAHKKLEIENQELRTELKARYEFGEMIYNSRAMKDIIETIKQVAPTNASVLIEGESGTGKELVARLIHSMSLRSKENIVPVHCASLTESLLASELFGHEKGAFTGAFERKIGRFEKAHNGTIFLDEIGEIKEEMQIKLLRVLQEGEFERVGGSKTIKVDTRLICATNKKLSDEIRAHRFREDLYYRINVVSIEIPPLRTRKDDIEPLVTFYLSHYSAVNNKNVEKITPEAMQALREYDWPGNVRELKNIIERLVVLARTDTIRVENIPMDLRNAVGESLPVSGNGTGTSTASSIRGMEKEMILSCLRDLKGNKSKVAEKLGISRRTLYRKIDEYEIDLHTNE